MTDRIRLSSYIIAKFNYDSLTIESEYLRYSVNLNYFQRVAFYNTIGEILKRRESKWRRFCSKDLVGINIIMTKLINEMDIKHTVCEYSNYISIGCQKIDYKTLRMFHDALGQTI